jgi:pSer/pThr/pTyr-binding forkhead associated (FHA) protein
MGLLVFVFWGFLGPCTAGSKRRQRRELTTGASIVNRGHEIRVSFPKPIAKAYANAELSLERTEGARSYLDAFEATAQYLALTGTAKYLALGTDKTLERALAEVLPRPSFGGWVRLVREFDKISREQGASFFGCDLTEKKELPNFAKLSKEIEGSGGAKATLISVFDRITNIRNRVAHQKLSPQELGNYLELLRDTLEELLFFIPVIREQPMVQAVRVENLRQGLKATLRYFQGEGMPRQEEKIMQQSLVSGALYLQAGDSLLELWPFFLSSGKEVVLLGGFEGKANKPIYFPTSIEISPNDLTEATGRLKQQCGFLFEAQSEAPAAQEVPRSLLRQIDKALAANRGQVSDEDLSDIIETASDFGLAPEFVNDLIKQRAVGVNTANVSPPIKAIDAKFFVESSIGRWQLEKELRLGRAAACQIVLNDPSASQLHAQLSLQNGVVSLDDLGSRFGTLLNNQKLSSTKTLQANDHILIGNTSFWFRVEKVLYKAIAQLTVEEGNERGLCVKGSQLTVGRDYARCQVVLTDAAVSGLHLEITRQENQFMVADKGSRNGSILRGKRLTSQPSPLQNGDTIILGGAVALLFQEVPSE